MSKHRSNYGKITKCVAARVYSLPTIQSALVGTIPRGTDVMLLNYDPEAYFCKVITASGIRGYCMRVFIDVIERTKSSPQPPVAEAACG